MKLPPAAPCHDQPVGNPGNWPAPTATGWPAGGEAAGTFADEKATPRPNEPHPVATPPSDTVAAATPGADPDSTDTIRDADACAELSTT